MSERRDIGLCAGTTRGSRTSQLPPCELCRLIPASGSRTYQHLNIFVLPASGRRTYQLLNIFKEMSAHARRI